MSTTNEYKLSFTAAEIDEKLSKIDTLVSNRTVSEILIVDRDRYNKMTQSNFTALYNNGVRIVAVVDYDTGDIIVYTNQVPLSIDTDRNVFNTKGWIGHIRLNTSGVETASDYASTTGYIPASSGASIRIAGPNWFSGDAGKNYVCSYDSNFNFISAVNNKGSYGGGTVSGDENVALVVLPANSNIAYVRVSAGHTSNDDKYSTVSDPKEGPGSYLIVTVNEDIMEV